MALKNNKIVLVTRSAVSGGVEEHVYQLARNLINYGYVVLWVVLTGSVVNSKYRSCPGIHFLKLKDDEGQSVKCLLLYNKLLNIIWRIKPIVVHSHGIRPMFLLSLLPFPSHTKRICSLHGSYLLMATDFYGDIILWKQVVSAFMHFFSYWRSHCFLAVSHRSVSELQNIVPFIILSKIEVIHNGVQCAPVIGNNSKCPPEIILNRLNLLEMNVIFAGRIDANKGVDLIIRAAAMNKALPIRYHLFGEGYKRSECEMLAETLGVHDRVHFWGYFEDLRDWLSVFDVFVLPSYSEGMSLVLLEAMAAGLPVIATNVGGTPEAMIHGVTGYLIQPGDSDALAHYLKILFEEKESRRRMGKNNSERIYKFFNSSIQMKKILNKYLSIEPFAK